MAGATLMIQGTSSSVGKSLLVAGLCRLFAQAGYRVAPFKAQNMALNSFVTADGGEMGRAQVVQAEAAGIAPTVDMNPILLKPEAAARSQVVVRGRVHGTVTAGDFLRRKAELWPVVAESLDSLRAAYDLVLIEGAGSPAEINLKSGDIVNMRVARYAGSPVLLAGDIDRGGVFAALLGTLHLLEAVEADLVRGFIINKFRGDLGLLRPGLTMIEERAGRPVLGVVPYLSNLGIAEEDSVALDERCDTGAAAGLDIAVIRLPYTQNFDDFDPLEREPGVSVRYVRSLAALGHPHLIVLPGSKTTIRDLTWLRSSGLAGRIVALAAAGVPVLGVCGGYQMLGDWILDPGRVEADTDRMPGLGLLPFTTEFRPTKRTHQVAAQVLANSGLFTGLAGTHLKGYEIHLGESRSAGQSLLRFTERSGTADGRDDGAVSEGGLIAGTYLHGLFANGTFRRGFLTNLARLSGHAWQPDQSERPDPYDRLAAVLEESISLNCLLSLLPDLSAPPQPVASTP